MGSLAVLLNLRARGWRHAGVPVATLASGRELPPRAGAGQEEPDLQGPTQARNRPPGNRGAGETPARQATGGELGADGRDPARDPAPRPSPTMASWEGAGPQRPALPDPELPATPGCVAPPPQPLQAGARPPQECECGPTCPDGAAALQSQSLSSPRCPRRAPPALNPRRPRPRRPRPGLGEAGGMRGCPPAGASLGRDAGLESRAGLADAPTGAAARRGLRAPSVLRPALGPASCAAAENPDGTRGSASVTEWPPRLDQGRDERSPMDGVEQSPVACPPVPSPVLKDVSGQLPSHPGLLAGLQDPVHDVLWEPASRALVKPSALATVPSPKPCEHMPTKSCAPHPAHPGGHRRALRPQLPPAPPARLSQEPLFWLAAVGHAPKASLRLRATGMNPYLGTERAVPPPMPLQPPPASFRRLRGSCSLTSTCSARSPPATRPTDLNLLLPQPGARVPGVPVKPAALPTVQPAAGSIQGPGNARGQQPLPSGLRRPHPASVVHPEAPITRQPGDVGGRDRQRPRPGCPHSRHPPGRLGLLEPRPRPTGVLCHKAKVVGSGPLPAPSRGWREGDEKHVGT
ncbi:transcription initiation factor TFIID subunit 4-like [Odocoileus virginianus]|uniref:Transcription initiation factor TFIID subunit 4-like n=1 Tax=Odocoileus virginianus TaxID=9874 RepID=A0ABM4HXU6_ODOVR